MRRASVLSGSAFRLAILFLMVFIGVVGAAGTLIVAATRASMEEQIRSYITEDVGLLHDANATDGEQELIGFVRDASATRPDKAFAFGLFKKDGEYLAGNVTSMPAFRGWGELSREAGQGDDGSNFIAYVEALDNNIIVVGRSQRSVTEVSDRILGALFFAGVVICVSVLAIGYFISRGVSGKLQVMDDTLGEVARGNSDIRLPIGPSNDQIDHVSRQINAHLDRLSEFMGLMRNTIVAIAHDLKSPLSRASILLQETAELDDLSPAADKLDQAQKELDALGKVLDTVLRISRIETSDDNSSFVAFSATTLMQEMAQTFEPVIEAAGQSLACKLPSTGNPQIFGDPRMVQQMLVNLIENANRHSGTGTHIEMELRAANGATIVSVADNGPGIPADRHEDVFQPFRRLNAERQSPGVGLGLALVRAIAVRHHARVALSDNRPGLRVVVTFPAAG